MDEVRPMNVSEGLFAIFVYLLAFWSGAVFLSILTSTMTQLYLMSNNQKQQLAQLRQFLSQNGISKRLALRVNRNAQHALTEQTRSMPEVQVEVIFLISQPLRVDIHFEMFSPKLAGHFFFAGYINDCPHVMRKVCHVAMEISTLFHSQDVLFSAGEMPAAPQMYIVKNGSLEYADMHEE